MSQLKIKNGNVWESIPAGGIGVPSGGTTGQVLQKSSNTDYATEWANAVGARIEEITRTGTTTSTGYIVTDMLWSDYDIMCAWATVSTGSYYVDIRPSGSGYVVARVFDDGGAKVNTSVTLHFKRLIV